MSEAMYVLGTGNANAVNCYNTCFALRDPLDGEFILVDAGGGNGILRILRDMEVPLTSIHHILVTHEHTDHILGIVWIIRMIAASMKQQTYTGNLRIYGHKELLDKIRTICSLTVQGKFCALFDDRIHFVGVEDGESRKIHRYDVTFFDIHSKKAKQFGFALTLHNHRRLVCLGDEPYHPLCEPYALGADWLLSEAFCLYADRDRFKPYEKSHSTAMDAARQAQELGVGNLVLWHTEDSDLLHRKSRYTQEASECFKGNIFVPDDGEIIPL